MQLPVKQHGHLEAARQQQQQGREQQKQLMVQKGQLPYCWMLEGVEQGPLMCVRKDDPDGCEAGTQLALAWWPEGQCTAEGECSVESKAEGVCSGGSGCKVKGGWTRGSEVAAIADGGARQVVGGQVVAVREKQPQLLQQSQPEQQQLQPQQQKQKQQEEQEQGQALGQVAVRGKSGL
ncbi:unnamed protein product, partial [Closterium sp. NIES-54]